MTVEELIEALRDYFPGAKVYILDYDNHYEELKVEDLIGDHKEPQEARQVRFGW